MKFSQLRRNTLASVLSLAGCLGISACTTAHTVAYLYVTSSKTSPGKISAYNIDSDTGALRELNGSPFSTGGQNPLAVIVSPNYNNVYLVNHDDSTLVEYGVNRDGSLSASHSYPLAGTLPTALAIDPTNSCLIVSFTYQPGFSAATPGPGGIQVFPINSDGTLKAAVSGSAGNYFPVGCNPVGVNVAAINNFVYVVDQNFATATPNCVNTTATSPVSAEPVVLGFSLNLTSGQLTSLPGTPSSLGVAALPGYQAGVQPSAIASEPTGRFVYVTDQAANQLIGYVVQTNGTLVPMLNGPFSTGLYPVSLTIDGRGKFLYVTNFNAGTVSGYALDLSTGTPAAVAASTDTKVGANPTCVTIEPSLGIYLFTSDYADNTITGKKLDPHTGALSAIQNSPYSTAGQPTCAAAIGAGRHAVQSIKP